MLFSFSAKMNIHYLKYTKSISADRKSFPSAEIQIVKILKSISYAKSRSSPAEMGIV